MSCLYSLLLLAAPAEAGVKGLAPFVDGQTVAVLRVDLTQVNFADPIVLDYLGPLGVPSTASWKVPAHALFEALAAAGARDLFAVARIDEDLPVVVVPLGLGANGKRVTAALAKAPFLKGMPAERLHGAVVAATPAAHKRLREARPAPRPELGPALAGKGLFRLALVPTADLPRVLEEVMPTLPAELGGGPIRPLARGLRWVALDLEVFRGPHGRLTIQAKDEASAKELLGLLGRALKALAASKGANAFIPGLEKSLPLLRPQLEAERIVVPLDAKAVAALIQPPIRRAVQARERERAEERLQKVLRALLAYEAAHKQFPPAASHDVAGRPLLSWRVHLLPYLGEGELYKAFRLDERWDSPHNKKLLARMPEAYRSSARLRTGATTILAPVGEPTLFPGRRGVRVAEVRDGLANTIALVDADDHRAVEWTSPEDWPFDADRPSRWLSRRYGPLLVGMADGTVRWLPADLDAKVLRALFTRAGGEAVTLP
jgi:hypothetical protein